MRVKATEIGYHGFLRRREGDTFNIRKLSEFSPNWMEFVNEDNISLYNEFITKKLTDIENAPKNPKNSLQEKIDASLVMPKKVKVIEDDAPPVDEDAPPVDDDTLNDGPEPEAPVSKKKKSLFGGKK